MARDLTKTAQVLHEIPIADMVKATAMGLIEAQFELDRRMIELTLQMGESQVKLGDGESAKRRSLLELGFTPSLYQFKEAVITLTIDITVAESEEFSIALEQGQGNWKQFLQALTPLQWTLASRVRYIDPMTEWMA